MLARALRALMVWLTSLPFARRVITESPIGRGVARRFVAGDTLDDAVKVAGDLNDRGLGAMLDLLGENVTNEEQAERAAAGYAAALRRIEATGLADANISIKLTQLGLDISEELCLTNCERVLRAANGTLVMIDMESSDYTERTIAMYEKLRAGHDNIGICLQAALHRTPTDVRRIAGPGVPIRLAKGAYLEPPDIAIAHPREVARAFARLGATILALGATLHVATHDPGLIAGARRNVLARGIPRERYEFQMLYGIRRDLQESLRSQGSPVRVYIPYGSEWYPYLTRRLVERPANVWFFLSNLFRR
ncbi:MAG: proline dehydrogenase family protein [Actinomycetota bacterium]